MSRISIPASGPYIEVTLPSGRVVRPTVAGDLRRQPTVNGYPRLDVPVKKRDLWDNLDLKSNDVPIDVWVDGRPQPIDVLEEVQSEEGATTVLRGRGGTELNSRARESYEFIEVHEAAKDIIQSYTSYAANVDTPPSTVTENQQVQSAGTQTEWEDNYDNADPYNPIITITSGSYGDGEVLTVAKTARVRETNAIGDKNVSTLVTDSNASNEDAVDLEATGEYVELNWNIDYTVPGEDIHIGLRRRVPNDPDSDGNFESPDIDYVFNGTQTGGLVDGAEFASDAYDWNVVNPNDLTSVDDQTSPTLRVECNGNSSGGTYRLDLIVLYDARYHDVSAADNTVDSNGYLSSPTERPYGVTKSNYPTRSFIDAVPIDAVAGGRAQLDVDDDTGIQEIALSNDRGQSFSTSGVDTSSYEVNFSSLGPALRQRFSLAATSPTRTTATPTQGYDAPEVDSYTLDADLDNTPILVDQSFDDDAMTVLQNLADEYADFLFEYRISASGAESVEWTTPGQRTSNRDDPVSRFQQSETVEKLIEKMVVKGSAQRRQGETFTANHGGTITLTNDEVQAGKEVVIDPTDGTQFTRGADYEWTNPLDGELTTISGGDMTDGDTYEIDYQYRPVNSYTVDGASNTPTTEVVSLSALTTERACGQVARRIAQQLDEPLTEATVTVPIAEAGWTIVDEIDLTSLPGDEQYEIKSIETTPEESVLQLGSRQSVGEVVGEIRTRLQSVSQRV